MSSDDDYMEVYSEQTKITFLYVPFILIVSIWNSSLALGMSIVLLAYYIIYFIYMGAYYSTLAYNTSLAYRTTISIIILNMLIIFRILMDVYLK